MINNSKIQLLKFIKDNPYNYQLLTKLSFIYFQEWNIDKAIEFSQKAFKLAPSNPVVLWDYGRALIEKENSSKALRILKKAFHLKMPQFIKKTGFNRNKSLGFKNDFRFEIALCYIQQDKFSLAVNWLKKYVSNYKSQYNYYSKDMAIDKIKTIQKLTSKRRNTNRLWLIFCEVKKLSKRSNIKYRRGFTNGIIIAKSPRQAVEVLRKTLETYNFGLVKTEKSEDLEKLIFQNRISKELKAIAKKVQKDKEPCFTSFCMYKN